MIWDDRLAEVWAEPGKAGAGVVIGAAAVLTARHVVAGALAGGRTLARVVRPGARTADWVPMTVLAEDADWDVALLGVSGRDADADNSGPRWLGPSSTSPVFVRLGTSAEHDCEAVGFPQAEVQEALDGSAVTTVRQSEHAVGMVTPAGQAKAPVNPERPLPRRWIPFDIEGPGPDAQTGWGGMSGAGVVLPDGRLAGLVVDAEAGHQQRRLYVVPFADALAHSGDIAMALTAALGGPVVIEVRDAPLYCDVLQDGCLGPDGFPLLVREASYKAFGVKLAGVPGEPDFLDYVPRDTDQKLHDGLQTAQAGRRMLLVVGGSAGGKSRSAAEAARLRLPGHRLLCPRQTSLARLHELPAADLGPALVWLDDVERYDQRAFRDTLERLLQSGLAVVATIRRSELDARKPKSDLHSPFGEALVDPELVAEVDWPVIWNEQDRKRVAGHVRYLPLLAWVAAGKSPSAWVVAGPVLEDRLRDAKADDERPARYALARAVLDWYRTGIAQPVPLAIATSLLQAYLPEEADPAEIEDALQWGLESVTGASRRTKQSLLTKTSPSDALTIHDYIQDANAGASARTVPDEVWLAALDEAASDHVRVAIGVAAYDQGNTAIAEKSWLPLVVGGISDATYNLGVLLNDAGNFAYKQADLSTADKLHNESLRLRKQIGDEQAVAGSLNNLGLLYRERGDYDTAAAWFKEALEINQRLGNHFWAAINLNNLGLVAIRKGDGPTAQQFEEDSKKLFETLGDDWGRAMALSGLGAALLLQGQRTAAAGRYRQSLRLQWQLKNPRGLAAALQGLAEIAAADDDRQRATLQFRAALGQSLEVDDQFGIADALEGLAAIAPDGEDGAARAAGFLAAADAFRRRTGITVAPAAASARDRVLARVQATLEAERWRRAWEAGETAPFKDVARQALGDPPPSVEHVVALSLEEAPS
jgi:tetratricopeptide (TPR) repeat protein